MSRSTKVVIASAAAGALALGVGIGIAGFASADPTASPSASPTSSASADQARSGAGKGDRRAGPGRGIDNAELAKQLAEKLGVEEAKVTEALKAIRETNRASKPSTSPSASPSATATTRPSRPSSSERRAALAKQLAEKLGVDEAKVLKALEEIQAAQDAERAAALTTKLDEAVKAGTLTQAEADAVKKAVEKGVISGR